MAGQASAESQVSPADLLRAGASLFDITVNSLARHVKDDPELLPCFITAILALDESIGRRVREATLAYTGYLLERVDQAHIDERRRIARDLHDRLGEGMSAALRQLELHEITSSKDPLTPSPWAVMAKDSLTEAMRRLRMVISGLRQDSIRSLETALVQYLDSVATDVDVRLRVSGDETWAPSMVIEEVFLIVQEAIRNALRHGSPRHILIGVGLAPHELHTWVEDDGSGFLPAEVSNGAGLAAMRERADLVGGRLTITSTPGHGTEVELLVPLAGHRDE
jgi:signal transduction histidine kinase